MFIFQSGDAPLTGETDPYWASVNTLLLFNGSLANSKSGGPVFSGTGVIDTATYFEGGGSLGETRTNNRYIEADLNLTLTGKFTIEWYSKSTWSSFGTFIEFYATGSPQRLWYGYSGVNEGTFTIAKNAAVYTTSGIGTHSSEWKHHAITRDANNVIRVFYNGNLIYSEADSYNILATKLRIGNYSAGGYGVGNTDCVRFTNGECRYTSAFTPPVVFPTN